MPIRTLNLNVKLKTESELALKFKSECDMRISSEDCAGASATDGTKTLASIWKLSSVFCSTRQVYTLPQRAAQLESENLKAGIATLENLKVRI